MKKYKEKIYLSFLDKILIVMILIGLLGIVNMNIAKSIFMKNVQIYSTNLANKFGNLISSSAFDSEIAKYKDNSFFAFKEDEEGNIKSINVNTYYLSTLSNGVLETIMNSISDIEKGNHIILDKLGINYYSSYHIKEGICYEIPFGIINDNLFLDFAGPNIPIMFKVLSDVYVDTFCNINEYAINSVMVNISLKIKINILTYIPYINNKIEVINEYPIMMNMIQGNIPNIYLGSNSTSSSIFKGGQ